jgi:hypothetical protein
MGALQEKDIEAIVAAKFTEHLRLQRDDIDAVASRTVVTMLMSLGIEQEDRRQIRADLDCLRRWRKNVEQAQSYGFKAAIAVIVSGFIGAFWLGIKVVLGK